MIFQVPRMFTMACVALAVVAPQRPGGAVPPRPAPLGNVPTPADTESGKPYTLAVIGDTPYGVAKLEEFPRLISLINGDSSVNVVVHLGDIKLGTNAPCTNEYNAQMHALFNAFNAPLVYTPGDNEWADCHVDTKKNGLYTPTERLEAVREEFFRVPGLTMGDHKMQVRTQASDTAYKAYVENVMWVKSQVVFATLNVPGSNDDLEPWGVNMPSNYRNYPSQYDERAARGKANAAWVAEAFATATAQNAAGVVLMFQADLWDRLSLIHGYGALVRQIATLSGAFGKPVLLLEGDSHLFRVDRPFLPDSGFRRMFKATPVASNVTRIVVEGANGRTEYLRVTVDPSKPDVFTWERVPLEP